MEKNISVYRCETCVECLGRLVNTGCARMQVLKALPENAVLIMRAQKSICPYQQDHHPLPLVSFKRPETGPYLRH